MLHAPRLPTVLALFALVGCQSERSAMEIVCDASGDVPDWLVDDAPTRATHVASYAREHVSNATVVQMLADTGTLAPAERAVVVRRAATSAGLTSCEWADELERPRSVPQR